MIALVVVVALLTAAPAAAAGRFPHAGDYDLKLGARTFIVHVPRDAAAWNAGTCCGQAQTAHADDVGFTLAILRDLARDLPLDRTRVYATGHSNGAMMAYRLAAEAAEKVAAIAPV
ncbi:MAG: hypothetical protein DMD76_30320, partial [Candidatus Rokuibacteriota bacterium]